MESLFNVRDEIVNICNNLPPRPSAEEIHVAKEFLARSERDERQRSEEVKGIANLDNLCPLLRSAYVGITSSLIQIERKRQALDVLDLDWMYDTFNQVIPVVSQNPRSPPTAPSFSTPGSPTSSQYHTASGTSPPPSPGCRIQASNPAQQDVRSKIAGLKDLLHSCVSSSQRTFGDELFKKRKSVSGSSDFWCVSNPARQDVRSKIAGLRSLLGSSVSFSQRTFGDELFKRRKSVSGEKWGFSKLLKELEVCAEYECLKLDLQSKLNAEIDCLPESIGWLSKLEVLILSKNQILTLPTSIGALSSLVRLNLCSNRIHTLPDSLCELSNLAVLNLQGNQLSVLPSSLTRLINLRELDLSSNRLRSLPVEIDLFTSLRILRVNHNDLREIPITIGRIGCLEFFSARCNGIRELPNTLAMLTKLRELDLSFNELKGELTGKFSLSLVTLNLSNNYCTSLPRSIGKLQNLEELDIRNNVIEVLPDSFRLLRRLSVFRCHKNPWIMPPRHIAESGAEVVVQYMNQAVANKRRRWTIWIFDLGLFFVFVIFNFFFTSRLKK